MPYSVRFKDRKPKIFLGFVAFGDMYPEMFESCVFWAFQAGAKYHDKFEVYVNVATRREQYRARNSLVQEAALSGADFMLMVDDDHTLADCPDLLDHFYNEEKPLQGGLYLQRRDDKVQPVIQKYNPTDGTCWWASMEDIPNESGPVDILGGGLNWIDMSLFDFMGEPHWWPYPDDRREVVFLPHPKYGLDMQFCIKAKEKLGVQPWLNMKVQVGHIIHERAVLRPPGILGHLACESCDSLMYQDGDRWTCRTCNAQRVKVGK